MPRMEGFTFLRILMSRQPTPVIVVSSYSQKENVFKALELGALDFIAKPPAQIAPDNTAPRDPIREKVLLGRQLRACLPSPPMSRKFSGTERPSFPDSTSMRVANAYSPPKHVV